MTAIRMLIRCAEDSARPDRRRTEWCARNVLTARKLLPLSAFKGRKRWTQSISSTPGRLYAVLRRCRTAGSQSHAVREAAVRPGEGLCSDSSGRKDAAVPSRTGDLECPVVAGIHRARQGAAGATELRLGRRRRHDPSHDGGTHESGRRESNARALQGHWRRRHIRAETEKWAKIVRESGAKAE